MLGYKKKEMFLESLKTCLERDVYSNISLQEVADEAGYSKGGLLHYFTNKEEIYLELVEYMFKKLEVGRGELESFVVTVGSFRIIDCDTIEISDRYISMYGPDQDKDGDGLPDSDEEPNNRFGSPGPSDTRKRIPFMEPCEP